MRFLEFLQDPVGDFSSKRLLGVASFVIAAILAFSTRRVDLVGTFLGFTSLLLGIGAVTKT